MLLKQLIVMVSHLFLKTQIALEVQFGIQGFRFLESMVEPVLNPQRKVLPPIAGFDISIVAALMGIEILRSFLLY